MIGDIQVPMWTWYIVLYFFLGGVAGGAYFLSAVIELVGSPEDRPVARMGYYIAFPLAILCAILLILDLGQPLRFWHMVLYSKTLLPWINFESPMSVGAYALLFFGLFSFLSFVDALIETGRLPWAPLRDKYSGLPRMIYAIIGGLFGFFLTAYTGELLATSQIAPWAHTPLLGGLFAASGAATGMAAIALGLAITHQKVGAAWSRLRQVDIVALLVELILLSSLLIWLGQEVIPLLQGITGILLIAGVLVIGILIPLMLQLRSHPVRAETNLNMVIIIAVLTLLGGLMMRTSIVMGWQGIL